METQTQEITLDQVIALLDKKYQLVYVDRNDKFSAEAVNKSIDESKPLEVDFEWYNDCAYNGYEYAVKELRDSLISSFDLEDDASVADDILSKYEDEIRDEIYNRDSGNIYKDLARNTSDVPVRIELNSNYDCINSNWLESQDGYSYKKSYFGDMVDALNLNPKKVKAILVEKGVKVIGRFPNKANRDGNELVSYQDFYSELVENSGSANLLTFIGTVDVAELLSLNGANKITQVTIGKGNKVGIYSSSCGGGSLVEMELLKPVTIDLINSIKGKSKYDSYRLVTDSGNGYSIKDTFGVYNSFFGGQVSLTIE